MLPAFLLRSQSFECVYHERVHNRHHSEVQLCEKPLNFKSSTLQLPTYAYWHLTCHLCRSSVLRVFVTGAQTWYMQMLHASGISFGVQQKQDSKIKKISTYQIIFNDIMPLNIYLLLLNEHKILCNFWLICYNAYTENVLRTVVARSRVYAPCHCGNFFSVSCMTNLWSLATEAN
jgi:hypothetical protein